MYIAIRNEILIMRFLTLIKRIKLPCPKISHMLLLYPFISVASRNMLFTIDQNEIDNIQRITVPQEIMGIVHIPTYLNKIVIWTRKDIKIINIMTQKIIVEIDLR